MQRLNFMVSSQFNFSFNRKWFTFFLLIEEHGSKEISKKYRCRWPSGKIALHLLFGWSLDKDKKSLDQSKQFSWKFGSIQIKAIPNPDHPPLGIFWTYHFFCTKHKIIENEKWKLLETLQYTIKEFNNYNVVCSTMHCPDGSRWGGGRGKGCTDFVYSIV